MGRDWGQGMGFYLMRRFSSLQKTGGELDRQADRAPMTSEGGDSESFHMELGGEATDSKMLIASVA